MYFTVNTIQKTYTKFKTKLVKYFNRLKFLVSEKLDLNSIQILYTVFWIEIYDEEEDESVSVKRKIIYRD